MSTIATGRLLMKKLLLAGIAALLLSTGAAHATERLPEAMLGNELCGRLGDEVDQAAW